MYLTKGAEHTGSDNFDWDEYFLNKNDNKRNKINDLQVIIADTRKHLKENESVFGFAFHKVMHSLFQSVEVAQNPNILELGAATGFLTRWIIQKFGGHATLVDRSKEAYRAFLSANYEQQHLFTYVKEDIFRLDFGSKKFDMVGSFGVIEHFINKKDIIEAHKKHVHPNGYIVIMIPLDSPLTRAFYEVNFELNTGYRELLTENELKRAIRSEGLTIINSAKSEGYAYDFFGVLCTLG